MSTVASVPFSATLLVRDTCLCMHVQRAARALARRFDTVLKPVGITSGQFSLLMSLNRPDAPGVPLATIGSVADLLGLDRTTLTAALKPLVRRGLAVIQIDRNDRRTRVLRLTDDGREVLARALPIWKQTHAEIDEEVGDPAGLRKSLNQLSGHGKRSDAVLCAQG
jgi:DNA-binding MarR family transcriptional regulator